MHIGKQTSSTLIIDIEKPPSFSRQCAELNSVLSVHTRLQGQTQIHHHPEDAVRVVLGEQPHHTYEQAQGTDCGLPEEGNSVQAL